MRVLVLGANGFIGSAIVGALIESGWTVRAVVRDPARYARRFPNIETVRADLRDPAAHEPAYWRRALDNIDAVVNAAGVLQPRRDADAWAIHCHAPKALYDACVSAGAKRVMHVSAIGVEEAETVYARSKRAGDEALMTSGFEWTILRPAVVFGDGSYGGTSMLRAVAACPFVTPLIGDGGTPMDFIHKDDLAAGILQLLKTGRGSGEILEPAGPERLSFREAVAAYRRWLGLPDRPFFATPSSIAKMLARVGDITKLDPLTTTSIAQFEARLTGDAEGFTAATGIHARGLSTALAAKPSESQDLWHARLYLLRPLIRLVLALLWFVSGCLGLLADPAHYSHILKLDALDPAVARAVGIATGTVDLAIASALILGWRLKLLAIVQFAMVLGYTLGLTILAPSLWGDLFGGLLKNIPILALIAVHRVLEEER